MARMKTSFVNNARNQCFLAGVYRRIDGEHLLLQSNNLSNAIPINFGQWATPPGDGELVQVAGHVRGLTDQASSRQNASVDVYHMKRPSLGSVPRHHAMLGGAKGGEGRGLDSFGEIKQRLMDEFAIDGSLIEYLMSGQKQESGFLNRVYLSGFVGYKAFIPPSHEGDSDGYIAFNLLQFPNPERAIPIRVMKVNQTFGKMLMKGQPINVVASMAIQTRATDDGRIERLPYLRTAKDSVSMALSSDFEGKSFPDWWRDMLRAELDSRRMQQKPAAGFTPTPAPMLAEDFSDEDIIEGVTVSDESV